MEGLSVAGPVTRRELLQKERDPQRAGDLDIFIHLKSFYEGRADGDILKPPSLPRTPVELRRIPAAASETKGCGKM